MSRRDYLFKPARSRRWYGLLQSSQAMVDAGFAPKRRVEIALGTENYEEARAKFEPYLGDYLRRRWEFENGRRGDWLVTLK